MAIGKDAGPLRYVIHVFISLSFPSFLLTTTMIVTRSRALNLPQLNLDIYAHIAHDLTQADLLNTCLASRAMRKACTRFLYSRIVIRTGSQARSLEQTLVAFDASERSMTISL